MPLVTRHITIIKRMASTSQALVYKSYGDPEKVIEITDNTSDVFEKKLTGKMVRIKILASPINPADINTIQGVYAFKPPLPAVAGNETCGEIMDIGPDVKNLQKGDWVVPSQAGFGSWRTYALGVEDFFIKIKRHESLNPVSLSQITVNPPTAYRMLKDYVQLRSGDSIIQNGANSSVGLNVIQLAKEWGISTLNVIRSRDNNGHLAVANTLKELGATHVVTEEELRDKDVMEKILSQISKPRLALNCVGGKNATDCMRHLDSNGIMVTYGGMSKQPVIIPTGALIFKDQKFYGFWMTRWNQGRSNDDPQRIKMFDEITQLMINGKLKSPNTIEFELSDYKTALHKVLSGEHLDAKCIFRPNHH